MRVFSRYLLVATVIMIAPAIAQQSATADIEAAAAAPAAQMPAGRVGRVSLVSGNVTFRAPGESGWSDAEPNDPIFAGVSLRTAAEARAEVRIGADAIDLADGTEIEIANLNDRVVQIAVPRGRIHVDLRRLGDGEAVEIDIPQGGVWLLQPGDYDIDAGNQLSHVAVFAGRARFAGDGADLSLDAGDGAQLTGANPAAAAIARAAPDAFVEWSRGRRHDETGLAAPYYVSPYMTGFDELDAAGSWELTAEYGEAWYPKDVAADWAPYRYGRWRWTAPWGWSWIDDQPWGFAPSHYGRWASIGERWAWVPGGFAAHPVYAPALVAFLGTPGVGLSYAESTGPAIGWFPLGPDEAYWPSYAHDLDYIRALNLADVRDVEAIRMEAGGEPPLEVVGGHLANRRFASVVPRPVFTGGRAVAPALLTLPEQRLLNAPAIMGSPRVVPPAPPGAVRVAVAPAVREHPPAEHVAAAKREAWARAVHVAAIRSRSYQNAARARGAHPRAPAYAAAPRPRHTIILALAHPAHGPARPVAHRKEVKR